MQPEPNNKTDREEYLKAYSEHAKMLKTGFVGYGVGVLVIFITKDRPWDTLNKSGYTTLICILLFLGVFSQVLISQLNKIANWYCYYGEFKPVFKPKWQYKISRWWEQQFWIDCLFDFVTIVTFVSSAIFMVRTFGT